MESDIPIDKEFVLDELDLLSQLIMGQGRWSRWTGREIIKFDRESTVLPAINLTIAYLKHIKRSDKADELAEKLKEVLDCKKFGDSEDRVKSVRHECAVKAHTILTTIRKERLGI